MGKALIVEVGVILNTGVAEGEAVGVEVGEGVEVGVGVEVGEGVEVGVSVFCGAGVEVSIGVGAGRLGVRRTEGEGLRGPYCSLTVDSPAVFC